MNNHKDKDKKPKTPPSNPAPEKPSIPPNKPVTTTQEKKPEKSKAKSNASGKEATKVDTKTTKQPESKSSSGTVIGILALLVALAVAAACYMLWQQFMKVNSQLNETQSIAQNASNTVTDAASTSSEIQGVITQLQNQVQTLENKLSQSVEAEKALQQQQEALQNQQQTLQTSVGNLQTTATNNSHPSGWNVSEALYLVNIANHRLNLEGDIDTAIAALKAADLRLKQTGDPGLLGARRILANEINALSSVELPDLNGIALSLASLEKNTESLIIPDIEPSDTFKSGINVDNQSSNDWKATANSIWNEVKSLVSVRRNDNSSSPPSLAPDQRFYLRQNLRFKLEAARIALLRKDTIAFRQNLNVARDWIQNYFVSDNAAAKNILDALDQMQSIELKPAHPDISASHKMLRALNKGRDT